MPKKQKNFAIITNFKTKKELIQFYNHKNLTLGSNEYGVHDFKLRTPAGERTQDHTTVHFVLRGKGFYTLAGKTFHVKENDIFVTPSNVRLNTVPDPEDPWKYAWFGCSGTGFDEIFKTALFSVNNPVYSCGDCASAIRSTLKRFSDFIPATDAAMRLQGISVLLEIFALITEERTKFAKQNADVLSKEHYMQQAIAILESNYSDPEFTIADICQELAVSHSYLCRIFKQLSGVTISEFLMQIRMREARVMLDKSTLSMYDVAFKCGFNDYAYFSRSFKKMFDMSPRQYRTTQIKKP